MYVYYVSISAHVLCMDESVRVRVNVSGTCGDMCND